MVTLDRQSRGLLPRGLPTAACRIPAPEQQPRKLPSRLPRSSILLLDLDSRLPNLALMKLSRHFKDQGKTVILARREARIEGVEHAYASAVFSAACTLDRLAKLRTYYGDSLVAGGTGIDVQLRLPPAIESLPADYDLYPELGDRAIGFLTRGCPYRCPFCVVPLKEDGVRQVSDLDGLVTRRRRKLILLDDDLLAHPKAKVFLEDMVRQNLSVNFNQTLDIRFVDEDIAALLLRLPPMSFSSFRSAYATSFRRTYTGTRTTGICSPDSRVTSTTASATRPNPVMLNTMSGWSLRMPSGASSSLYGRMSARPPLSWRSRYGYFVGANPASPVFTRSNVARSGTNTTASASRVACSKR